MKLNTGWYFTKQDGDFSTGVKRTEEWEVVNLPHTWNAFDGQDGGNDYYRGSCWYHAMIERPEAKRILIRFYGVNHMAEVWCNGSYVGKHMGGFSAFTYDLTEVLKTGLNDLTVRVDNSKGLPIYPQDADFTFFGGIYRKVELICLEEAHFDMTKSGSDGVFITADSKGKVTVEAYVLGGDYVRCSIIDKDGTIVAEGKKAVTERRTVIAEENPVIAEERTVITEENPVIAEERTAIAGERAVIAEERKVIAENRTTIAGESSVITEEAKISEGSYITFQLKVDNPQLWQGIHNPYLYTAKLTLIDREQDVDQLQIPFGIRSFSLDAKKGFYLNDKPYSLQGVCRHQDRENMGWAITEAEHQEDMELIREIGANTIRLAHYQHAAEFYDLCDKYGMVVWAEIPFISAFDPRTEAVENTLSQLTELILQNYNHPSICFWGIGNELGIGGESSALYDNLHQLNTLAKKLDKSRLTALANLSMTKPDSPLMHITDLVAFNEYLGWYEGTMEEQGSFVDTKHKQLPDTPIAVSEYGAEAVLRYHSSNPKVKDYTEEYQALVHEHAQKAFAERPYLCGTWLWNMFDFAADNRDEGGCKGRNNKGLVTYDRRIRKDSFYLYKAWWSKEPFVYITGHRYTQRVEECVTIKIYSNCSVVTLLVNETQHFTLTGSHVFIFQNVTLVPGNNRLAAYGEAGALDELILERVATPNPDYVLPIEKANLSDHVTQWFANLVPQSKELEFREGYLSVEEDMNTLILYPEALAALEELFIKPLEFDYPDMGARLRKGGALPMSHIWPHIKNKLPEQAYLLLNERLIKVKK